MDLASAKWRKSSYTGGENDYCVEVADLSEATAVRDSKHPHGGTLLFAGPQWAQFIATVKTQSHLR
ncbi:DUF397 domain-containing protein [Saccharopolyspora shandongensis]|uniref:DUF397 domain-containing protein n=1 Tax=Saccharopolyspora shandongensis TaxID=418495 RepID=UPI0033E7BFAB